MLEKQDNQRNETVRKMTMEELEAVSGGLDKVCRVEFGFIEMPDEPQLTYLKDAIRRQHCRCGWAPETEDQVRSVINGCVLQGNNGYYCPRCGSVVDASGFYWQLYRP